MVQSLLGPPWPSHRSAVPCLQDLARHVERQVCGIDHALDKGEPAGQQVLVKLVCGWRLERERERREGNQRRETRLGGGQPVRSVCERVAGGETRGVSKQGHMPQPTGTQRAPAYRR